MTAMPKSNMKIWAMPPAFAISPVAIGSRIDARLEAVATIPVTVIFASRKALSLT
nr:hypothetical protein P5659_00485 [Bacillus subtilis]